MRTSARGGPSHMRTEADMGREYENIQFFADVLYGQPLTEYDMLEAVRKAVGLHLRRNDKQWKRAAKLTVIVQTCY